MASSLISSTPPPTPATTTTTAAPSRDLHVHNKKKKKPHSKHNHHHHQQQQQQHNQIKWKSPAQQSLYSSKLRQALAGSNHSGGKAVRDTADRVLAASARGRTRWSRAILTNRIKLNYFRKNSNKKQQIKRVAVTTPVGPVRSRRTRFSVYRLKGKTVPAVQKKVRFLGRLVPGCRKEPLPVILEEAIDYIPALEMQVRAMSALANLLLGPSSSSSSSSGAGGAPAS